MSNNNDELAAVLTFPRTGYRMRLTWLDIDDICYSLRMGEGGKLLSFMENQQYLEDELRNNEVQNSN